IDPSAIEYVQPDFRPVAEIDATGLAPVPYHLVIRRCGDETAVTMPASAVRALVAALYRMYGLEFRERDMAPLWRRLDAFPDGDAPIRLLEPIIARAKSADADATATVAPEPTKPTRGARSAEDPR